MSIKNPTIMEKERKITAPDGFEIEKVEIMDGVAVVTFREKERKLPKSWEELCEMYPLKKDEYYINEDGRIYSRIDGDEREVVADKSTLPNRATAEAVLALCQLIQLRNAYNGDWVPDWDNDTQIKFVITFAKNIISSQYFAHSCSDILYFKTKELRDEFLRNFRDLINKLKPLYGIKEGGEK